MVYWRSGSSMLSLGATSSMAMPVRFQPCDSAAARSSISDSARAIYSTGAPLRAPSARNCSARVVLPVPGTPSTRYRRSGSKPPVSTVSRPGTPVDSSGGASRPLASSCCAIPCACAVIIAPPLCHAVVSILARLSRHVFSIPLVIIYGAGLGRAGQCCARDHGFSKKCITLLQYLLNPTFPHCRFAAVRQIPDQLCWRAIAVAALISLPHL